jgi:hypothetical protein
VIDLPGRTLRADLLPDRQTPEAAESSVERRLHPALPLNGVKETSSYPLEPMRNLFSLETDVIERLGSTALPGASASRARSS